MEIEISNSLGEIADISATAQGAAEEATGYSDEALGKIDEVHRIVEEMDSHLYGNNEMLIKLCKQFKIETPAERIRKELIQHLLSEKIKNNKSITLKKLLREAVKDTGLSKEELEPHCSRLLKEFGSCIRKDIKTGQPGTTDLGQ